MALRLGKGNSEDKIHMTSRRRQSLMETIESPEFILYLWDMVATLVPDSDYTSNTCMST